LKEFLIKSKWIYKYSKPFLLSIIIITLLGVVSSLSNIYKALLMKKLIDNAISIHIDNMILYLILFGVITITDILLQSLSSILTAKSYNKMHNNIQKRIYTYTLNAKWIEFSKYHSGDITTRITSDADSVIAVIAFLLSPVIILISRFYSTKLKNLYKIIQEIESKYRSIINESIQNTVIIKSFCMEKSSISVITNLQEEKLNLKLSQSKLNVVSNFLLSTSS
jgi:ATP-binding cassette subfamily B protein